MHKGKIKYQNKNEEIWSNSLQIYMSMLHLNG